MTIPSIPGKYLLNAISSSATTFLLSDILAWDLVALSSSDFAATGYGCLRTPDGTPLSQVQLEFFTFDPTTIATVTGISFVNRGLDYRGGTAAAAKPSYNWPAGTIVELGSNMPALLTQLQTALGSAATTSAIGLTKMSVAPVSAPSPIAVGDNDTRVPTAAIALAMAGNNTDIATGSGNKLVTQTGLQHNAEKYAADAQGSDTYVITLSPAPTSYTNGMVVYFKANTANTDTASINVNGLGAKTIVKYVSTTLTTGDIAAGMFCALIYDGTNMVLQNPSALSLIAPISSVGAATATASIGSTQTINTAFTTPFTPSTITVYYKINALDNGGVVKDSAGIATFNGTTLTGAFKLTENSATTTFAIATLAIDATAISAGVGSGSGVSIAITITSLSSTGYTVTVVYTGTGSGTCSFYPVAFA